MYIYPGVYSLEFYQLQELMEMPNGLIVPVLLGL